MGGGPHSFGPFVLRPGRELLRDGKAVPIGNRALHLLETMLEADGGVVTKADMMARVWPGMIVEDGNITVQIAASCSSACGSPGQLRGGSGWPCDLGAFFGIAVVLATHIVPPERSGRAPAQLLAGVTTVNVRGVTVALSLYKSAISPPQT